MKHVKQKAILRWPGAKWKLAPWIIKNLPEDHFTYCEPFGGSAAILLSKTPSKAEVYNDLDSNLVNFFQAIRNHRDELVRRLKYTPYSREEYEACWAALQEPFDDPVEQARCFATTVFQARSSMIRAGAPTGWRIWAKESDFSQTPGDQWAQYAERIEAVADRLRKVQIENRPALEVIKTQDSPGTLFYVDPPYVEETRQTKKHYQHEMGAGDDNTANHLELLNCLKKVQGKVVLSGYDNELYRDVLADWTVMSRMSRADCRAKRVEVVWLNAHAIESRSHHQMEASDLFTQNDTPEVAA